MEARITRARATACFAGKKTALVRRAARTLREHRVQLVGNRVLVLCSGGVDSVVLVDILARLPRGARPAALDVLFCDHGRREVGVERAAAEAAAQDVGARFHVRVCATLDTDADFEARARTWRYGEAVALASELDAGFVATGHNADDQLETLLYGLVAASGSRALRGMPLVRPLDAEGLTLVRPLLTCTRADIVGHATAQGLEHGDDPTNADLRHRRNLLRHSVVPALLRVHPGAGVNLLRSSGQIAAQDDVTAALADSLLAHVAGGDGRLGVLAVRALPEAAARELVAAWLRANGVGRSLTSRIVTAVVQLANTADSGADVARVDLAHGACVLRDRYDLVIGSEHFPASEAHCDRRPPRDLFRRPDRA